MEPSRSTTNGDDLEASWIDDANKHLLGRTITSIRYLSEQEAEEFDWLSRPVVLQLNDGTVIYPGGDDEGNTGGALFGQSPDGEPWTLPVIT